LAITETLKLLQLILASNMQADDKWIKGLCGMRYSYTTRTNYQNVSSCQE
jgi:hypothetical protein